MNRNTYRLADTEGNVFWQWTFQTWSEAHHYRCSMGRPDWDIKAYKAY